MSGLGYRHGLLTGSLVGIVVPFRLSVYGSAATGILSGSGTLNGRSLLTGCLIGIIAHLRLAACRGASAGIFLADRLLNRRCLLTGSLIRIIAHLRLIADRCGLRHIRSYPAFHTTAAATGSCCLLRSGLCRCSGGGSSGIRLLLNGLCIRYLGFRLLRYPLGYHLYRLTHTGGRIALAAKICGSLCLIKGLGSTVHLCAHHQPSMPVSAGLRHAEKGSSSTGPVPAKPPGTYSSGYPEGFH